MLCIGWADGRGHPVAPSTPGQDQVRALRAWQQLFASLFALQQRGPGSAGSFGFTRALDHPDVAYAFVRTLVEPAAIGCSRRSTRSSRPTGSARAIPAPARVVVLELGRQVRRRSRADQDTRQRHHLAGPPARDCGPAAETHPSRTLAARRLRPYPAEVSELRWVPEVTGSAHESCRHPSVGAGPIMLA